MEKQGRKDDSTKEIFLINKIASSAHTPWQATSSERREWRNRKNNEISKETAWVNFRRLLELLFTTQVAICHSSQAFAFHRRRPQEKEQMLNVFNLIAQQQQLASEQENLSCERVSMWRIYGMKNLINSNFFLYAEACKRSWTEFSFSSTLATGATREKWSRKNSRLSEEIVIFIALNGHLNVSNFAWVIKLRWIPTCHHKKVARPRLDG